MASGVHRNAVLGFFVLVTLAQSGCAPSPAQAENSSSSTPAYAVRSSSTVVASELLAQLSAKEWGSVALAAREVKGRGGEALPLLMELMKRDEEVKLVDTADLIYPGAETFYGHGYVVSYDIDWLPVRAGWILEELTFQDFGFREGGLSGEELMEATVQTRHEGKFDVPLDEAVKLERDRKLRAKNRSAAVHRAMDWWEDHQQGWTRVAALQQALGSDSPARQVEALSYLRYPDSGCPGLDLEVYRRRLRPLVEKFAVGGAIGYEGVRAQACLLMSEVPDERRSYNIDGVSVGMSLEEALARCPGLKLDPSASSLRGDISKVGGTVAAVEGGEIVAVRGSTLSDGQTLLVREGDTARRISQKVVPLDLESTPLFLGACDSESSVIMALDDDTSALVSVQLLPAASDRWNSKWQVGER